MTEITLQTERRAIDPDLSRRMARQLGAYFGNCWFTCSEALGRARLSKKLQGWVYVEGWVTTRYGITVEHGWLETPDQVVIDPTYALHTPDDWPADHRYFHGVAWTPEQCRALGKIYKKRPFVNANRATADPAVFPAYWEAHDDAYRALYGKTQRELFAHFMALDAASQT